ncbi:MAG: CotH kinase family protein, partial [Clostridia bacterium]|nr:CotH kinase family protein [Clostridia bacterium]
PILVFALAGDKENGLETGMLSVYNWTEEQNSLFVSPTQAFPVAIRIENTSESVKPNVDITVRNTEGETASASILGMMPDSQWHLNSLRTDPSMLRSYTVYRTAAKFMNYVPRVAFCEVLIERAGERSELGVYELCDTVGVGPGKVNLSEPDPMKTRTDYFLVSDMARQGRLMSTRQIDGKYVRGYTSLLYPTEDMLSREQIEYIEKDYTTIEKRVTDLNDYSILLDVESLIDYYIVNLYFGNSNAGKSMTYLTNTISGKLQMGPIYDFDLALGNLNGPSPDPEEVTYEHQLFLSDMIRDNGFVSRLLRRFVELRRTVLREESVYQIIDETRNFLKCAKQRDDYRWARSEESEGISAIYRNGTIESTEYERDLYRIKAYLTKHASEIRNTFAKIEEEQRIAMRFEGGNGLLLFVALVLFFIPSILINRKG